MLNLNQKKILVTGGTGSFGRAFTDSLLSKYPNIERLVVFSRDEQKQYEMAHTYSREKYPCMEYILGDVRDLERLSEACEDIDIIIHSAAMKHVPAAESNPVECVKTNIIGSYNITVAARKNKVQQVVALSTDKAASPINFYGASKLCLEKLFLQANSSSVNKVTRYSIVRYGNVFGSKGSVIPFFLRKREEGHLPITHPDMTRFSILMEDGINLVYFALEHGWGGEVILPIAPSYRITDVAQAIAPSLEHRIVGIRKGEKLSELMFTAHDADQVVRRDEKFYVICPYDGAWTKDEYILETQAVSVKEEFEYDSATNNYWLSVQDIRELIKKEIQEDFIPY